MTVRRILANIPVHSRAFCYYLIMPNQERENDMRYTAKRLESGQYAVCYGRKYYPATIGTKEEATIEAIKMTGYYYQEELDKCQAALESLGAVSESDPTGWLA